MPCWLLQVLTRFIQKLIQPLACLDHGLYRILSFYWLAHFYLMKKYSKVLHYFGLDCGWNSSNILLTSRNPKNNCWLSNIFEAWIVGKDHGLWPYKPWSEQAGGWIHFRMKRLRTLKSFQIFKTKMKKSKTFSGWCLFEGLSNDTTVLIQSGRTVPLNLLPPHDNRQLFPVQTFNDDNYLVSPLIISPGWAILPLNRIIF